MAALVDQDRAALALTLFLAISPVPRLGAITANSEPEAIEARLHKIALSDPRHTGEESYIAFAIGALETI